jgi:hypothetical protein
MKIKRSNVSSQLLIIIMAALVLMLMLQFAQAQTSGSTQVLRMDMPQKSVLGKLRENTTFNYYHQFLGPTLSGRGGQSYNVFQEARTPYQSFHAMSLAYRVNPDWAMGVSVAAVNAYGETTTSQQNGDQGQMLRDEFFNARAFVNTPALATPIGTLFTTLSYEAPTSVVARRDEMLFGAVLTQSFAFKLPSVKWTSGLMWQYYRAFYNENVVTRPANYYFPGSLPERNARQTTIVSGGPYLAYRFNDRWGMNSSVTFDWDQRGDQTGTQSYNNNLPNRARLGVTYYPTRIKQIANVGIFTQGLLNYTTDTQAVGGEFALKF